MLTFIKMEFLKLKRSKIFLLSIIGAILPPLLMFIAVTSFDEGQTFEALFTNVNMYMSAMFAVMIFAIIISYLFGREYNADYPCVKRKVSDKQICHVSGLDCYSNSGDKSFNTHIWFCSRS